MKNTTKIKSLKVIQKIGAILMLIAGLMVILKMVTLLPESKFAMNDVKNYTFLVGVFLYFLPCLSNLFLKKGKRDAMMLILVSFLYGTQAMLAQEIILVKPCLP